MGGYWGTVVVARPRGPLVDEAAVAGYGHEKRWLRDLGAGWQMLESNGADGPPDLLAPTAALVSATGQPVLAVYISDGSCAAMCAATPEWTGPFTHVWDVDRLCETYRHQPRDLPEPAARGLEAVSGELVSWSEAAGLPADADAVCDLLARPVGRSCADDLLFELVKALGVPRIGRTRPWALPIRDSVFGSFTGLGPPFFARQYARDRYYRARHGEEVPPVLSWETEALALEAELWASLYLSDVDVVGLARRVVEVQVAFLACPNPFEPGRRWDEPAEGYGARLARFEAETAAGTFSVSDRTQEARCHADRRASTR
jgi:hypothetical protein